VEDVLDPTSSLHLQSKPKPAAENKQKKKDNNDYDNTIEIVEEETKRKKN